MRFLPSGKPLWLGLCGLLALAAWALFSQAGARPAAVSKPLQVAAVAPEGELLLDAGVASSSTTAAIVFVTVPSTKATVTWGKKLLGKILPGKPLVVVRPRDSGPLDVMVRAPGYLSVQTRAHTFSDSRISVKLTRPDKKNELLGYRIPLDAGPDGAIEGGAPDAGVYGEGGFSPYAPPAMPGALPTGTPPSMY